MPISGGVLTATAADGSLFTLTVPQDALLTATQITLTPLAAIDNRPLGGATGAGVQLEPEGLQFFYPVTLTIQTTAAIPVTDELSLAYHGDGQEFYRYPLALGHTIPTFQLMHFSGVVYGKNLTPAALAPDASVPTNPEDQLKQELHDLLQRERQAQLLGGEGDPHLGEKFVDLMKSYYQQVVRPELLASESDCNRASNGGIARALNFDRQLQLLGESEAFVEERAEIYTSISIAFDNCWREKTQPCVNFNDPHQMSEILGLMRQSQLLGIGEYDLNGVPQCTCAEAASVNAWNASVNISFNRSVDGVVGNGPDWASVSVNRSSNFTALLESLTSTSTFRVWGNILGSHTNPLVGNNVVNDTGRYFSSGNPNGIPYSTNGAGDPENGQIDLWLDKSKCTYELRFDSHLHTDDYIGSTYLNSYLTVLFAQLKGHSANVSLQPMILAGSMRIPVPGCTFPTGDYALFGHGYATGLLQTIIGCNNKGMAQVSWVLTPVP
jgi:hypothetical protein